MRVLKKIVIAAALATSALAPMSPAEAMPISGAALTIEHQSAVTNVAWRRTCRYGRCRRVWVNRRVVIVPRVVIRPRVVRPRIVIRRNYNAHVNWCLSRYRSYNPATNTYIGYDGLRHVCISPF